MSYKQDWLMRQIESMTQMIAHLVFHKDTISREIRNEAAASQTDLLHQRLSALLDEDKICQAENLLFESFSPENTEHIRLAVEFYARLNKLADEYLEAHDFSREEIKEGLTALMKRSHLDFGGW